MPQPGNDKLYSELAEKWLNGTITEEEKTIFLNWYNHEEEDTLTIPSSFAGSEHELKNRIWANIHNKKDDRNKGGTFLYLFRYAAAAVVFLMMGAGMYYLVKQPGESTTAIIKTITQPNNVIAPGGNKATLTLADGGVVLLDDAHNGKIGASQGNMDVVKLKNGLLAYQVGNQDGAIKANAINILTTPKGGQYQVQLPDGTMVWLNAASSLKYPTYFTGKERVVELTGEGYFEVAKNKDMPFKVKVKDMEVAVLGTHFNIMAYSDESTINTTLLEGSVKINTPQYSKMIVPGEQAQLSANGKINIATADLEEAVAWKNGYFQFASADMQTVLRQVKRWYDADIIYAGNIDEHFTGTISRSVDAEKVLKKLQLTGAFKFEIKNKQIFITK